MGTQIIGKQNSVTLNDCPRTLQRASFFPVCQEDTLKVVQELGLPVPEASEPVRVMVEWPTVRHRHSWGCREHRIKSRSPVLPDVTVLASACLQHLGIYGYLASKIFVLTPVLINITDKEGQLKTPKGLSRWCF